MLRNTLAIVALICPVSVMAHDTWIETNTNIVRSDDAIYLDLCLGNHGNEHRDFKFAGKTELEGCALSILAPDGRNYELIDRLVDTGYAPKEGFWRSKFAANKAGLYLASHTREKIVNHGRPLRAIKSGKTFFIVSPSLDRVAQDYAGFDRVLGHPLEIVAKSNPVAPMGPGQKINIQVLFLDKPLPKARVSFIPRGESLHEEFDERYERVTDQVGQASFTPNTGNQYLVAVRHETADKGDGYDGTAYSATLTVFVPETCPCCAE